MKFLLEFHRKHYSFIYQAMPAFFLSTHTAIIQYDINTQYCVTCMGKKKMVILPYPSTRHMRNADRGTSRNQVDSHNLQKCLGEIEFCGGVC